MTILPTPPHPLAPLQAARRLVVKLGSQVLVDEQGRVAIDRLAGFVRQIAGLRVQGRQVVLVSSGAVPLGRQALGLTGGPITDVQQRACAAIGQSQLINLYRQLFQHYDVTIGQVLINPQDFSDRARFCNAQETLRALLAHNALPILNENDTLSEPRPTVPGHINTASFGDNDQLSALVAFMVEADLLVLLSNVNGLYTDNPFINPAAQRLPYIPNLSALEADAVQTAGTSTTGRGGMVAKLKAIGTATRCGIPTILTSGLVPDSLLHSVGYQGDPGQFPGTYIASQPEDATTSLRRWIGMSSGYRGVVRINAGAATALREQGASLLAVGIVDVLGQFDRGQVVSVQNEAGEEVARGLTSYSAEELRVIQGQPSHQFGRLLNIGAPLPETAIHRDKLFLYS